MLDCNNSTSFTFLRGCSCCLSWRVTRTVGSRWRAPLAQQRKQQSVRWLHRLNRCMTDVSDDRMVPFTYMYDGLWHSVGDNLSAFGKRCGSACSDRGSSFWLKKKIMNRTSSEFQSCFAIFFVVLPTKPWAFVHLGYIALFILLQNQ